MNENNCNKEVNGWNIDDFTPSKSNGITNGGTRGGVMSVVNAETGKRVVIKKEVLDRLGVEEKVQFSFSKGAIAIGAKIINNSNYFNIKMGKNKGNIYSSGLVSEITDLYNLDFTGKTSVTFDNFEYKNIQGVEVAIIKIR